MFHYQLRAGVLPDNAAMHAQEWPSHLLRRASIAMHTVKAARKRDPSRADHDRTAMEGRRPAERNCRPTAADPVLAVTPGSAGTTPPPAPAMKPNAGGGASYRVSAIRRDDRC
jgi:hypothetical protein